ncbi:MAG: hypothetical protein PHT30_05720, partial [Bacilli bacterium]|nr:hypothetical protein [Bacilli bacterium]
KTIMQLNEIIELSQTTIIIFTIVYNLVILMMAIAIVIMFFKIKKLNKEAFENELKYKELKHIINKNKS